MSDATKIHRSDDSLRAYYEQRSYLAGSRRGFVLGLLVGASSIAILFAVLIPRVLG